MKQSSKRIFLIVLAGILIASWILFGNRQTKQAEAVFLDKYGLSGLTVEEITNKLDSSTEDPAGLKASITGEYLALSDETTEVKLPLSADKFYLSFAPYISQTHPCGFHSLSSCRGELANTKVHALIKDSEGNELLNADITTMENGFVGVWLPRNIDATVTVSYNGLVASAPISTYADSETCLTTPLQLN